MSDQKFLMKVLGYSMFSKFPKGPNIRLKKNKSSDLFEANSIIIN